MPRAASCSRNALSIRITIPAFMRRSSSFHFSDASMSLTDEQLCVYNGIEARPVRHIPRCEYFEPCSSLFGGKLRIENVFLQLQRLRWGRSDVLSGELLFSRYRTRNLPNDYWLGEHSLFGAGRLASAEIRFKCVDECCLSGARCSDDVKASILGCFSCHLVGEVECRVMSYLGRGST